MSVYDGMTEEQLGAEIEALRAQIVAVTKGGTAGVKSVAGEGRRMEFFEPGGGTSVKGLRLLLAEAEALWTRKFGGGSGGTAIGVLF